MWTLAIAWNAGQGILVRRATMNSPMLVLVTILSALAALVLLAVVVVRRRRARVSAWIQALFRRPPGSGKPPGPRHYYKPYWS
jgi:hypothetical protein